MSQRDVLAFQICAARHYPVRDLSDVELSDALIPLGVRVIDVAEMERVYNALVLIAREAKDAGNERCEIACTIAATTIKQYL